MPSKYELADTKYELADPGNTTIDVWTNCAISLIREEPETCSTLTGLLRVKLCRYGQTKVTVHGCRQSIHRYLNPKQTMWELSTYSRSDSRVKDDLHRFQMDKSWSIRAGAANALENQATAYPVTCLGHVKNVKKFQLVFGVGVLHWTLIVPTCGNNLRIYSISCNLLTLSELVCSTRTIEYQERDLST